MSFSVSASGIVSPTIGTESTLKTDTANGTYSFESELGNMVNGDIVELRMKTICTSTGALAQAWKGSYGNTQINSHKESPPIASDQSLSVTIKQLSGTFTINTVSSGTNFIYGSTITGSVSAAKALLQPLGGGPLSTTATTAVMLMTSGAFSTSDVGFVSGSSASLTFNITVVAPSTFAWKLLRI